MKMSNIFIMKTTHNPPLLFNKRRTQCTFLLCGIWTCFVMSLKGPAVCVCVGHSACATLAGLLWHSIYGAVIWSLSFSLHPKFLCPCATKISLCVRVNHPVICTCYFKKRPRVSFDSCCLAFIFMRLIFTSSGCVSAGRSINTFYPHCGNNTDIKRFFFFSVSKLLPQIKPEQNTSLFVWVILKPISDTICVGHILSARFLMGITRGSKSAI